MDQLQVVLGASARATLCEAFAAARTSIDAEYHSITDPSVIASLNAAAQRNVHVRIHVEAHPDRYDKHATDQSASSWVADSVRRRFSKNVEVVLDYDPDELMHAKAAVIDEQRAYISTANPTVTGFTKPGEVLVVDSNANDVKAVSASINHEDLLVRPSYVVTGPSPELRSRVEHIFDSPSDLRIASEDFSDEDLMGKLLARSSQGHHDRLLVQAHKESVTEKWVVAQLAHAGVEVHLGAPKFMHEKYVDGGDELYVGSANLTRNGLDESHEVGLVAPAGAMLAGAAALRADFDSWWAQTG